MNGRRVKAIMEQARIAAMDGSVIKSHEYKRLKKMYVHPTYAPVTRTSGVNGNPMQMFTGAGVIYRKLNGQKAGMQNFN